MGGSVSLINGHIDDDVQMTDEQIIKALECCINSKCEQDCFGCPYYGEISCVKKNGIDLLNLINRKNAEIERLKDKLNTAKREIVETIPLIEEDIKIAKAEAVKEIIERLEAEITISDKYVRIYNDTKDRTYNNSLREALRIVKEMVGE